MDFYEKLAIFQKIAVNPRPNMVMKDYPQYTQNYLGADFGLGRGLSNLVDIFTRTQPQLDASIDRSLIGKPPIKPPAQKPPARPKMPGAGAAPAPGPAPTPGPKAPATKPKTPPKPKAPKASQPTGKLI